MKVEMEEDFKTRRIVALIIQENYQFDYVEMRADWLDRESYEKGKIYQKSVHIPIQDINRYVLMAFSDDRDYFNRNCYAVLEEENPCCFFLYDKLDDKQGTRIIFQFKDKEVCSQYENGNYDFNLITRKVHSAVNTAKYYLNLVNSGDRSEKPYEALFDISLDERKMAQAYLDFRSFSKKKLNLMVVLFFANLISLPFSSSLFFLFGKGVLLALLSKTLFINFKNYHLYHYDFFKRSKDFLMGILRRGEKEFQTIENKDNVYSLGERVEKEEEGLKEEKKPEIKFESKDEVLVEIARLTDEMYDLQKKGFDCSEYALMLEEILKDYNDKKEALKKDEFWYFECFVSLQDDVIRKLIDLKYQFDLALKEVEEQLIYSKDLALVLNKINDLRNNPDQSRAGVFERENQGKRKILRKKR